MCGIVGYVGKKQIVPTLMRGLQRLEYRGYDSAGVAWQHEGGLMVVKSPGKLEQLAAKLGSQVNHDGKLADTLQVGIAHTRWATHGGPTEVNAHPHTGCRRKLQVVHNGIIENFAGLKAKLEERGHKFSSETDTEVLAHLFEDHLDSGDTLEQAVRHGLRQVRGTYGILVMDPATPRQIVAARHGSPLVVGVGDGEYIIASDISPIIEHTSKVVYLEDGEMATVSERGLQIVKIANHEVVEREHESVEWTVDDVERGGYAHYMLKEIVEQPAAVTAAQQGRSIPDRGLAKLGGLELAVDRLAKVQRVTILACGTAYHAGLVGEDML
ncbi:MAG: isomerizing glutamine--fructose-6-phosphate transaminase, partial [Patescibacteria group bacterium]|nr:isomerizing glutamine--fructose-6-phosphate transaminase [Patescibacteria group bacterium]